MSTWRCSECGQDIELPPGADPMTVVRHGIDCSYMQYDPKLHFTAAELRAAGATIPSNIPDCAWIPRTALKYADSSVQGVPGGVDIRIDLELTAAFRWVEMKGTIEL